MTSDVEHFYIPIGNLLSSFENCQFRSIAYFIGLFEGVLLLSYLHFQDIKLLVAA
jgi:hypothetical protein